MRDAPPERAKLAEAASQRREVASPVEWADAVGGEKETGGLGATRPPSGWSRFVSMTKMVPPVPAVDFSVAPRGGDSSQGMSMVPRAVQRLPAV